MTEYKKAVFSIDGFGDEKFAGFSNGSYWNGNACPFFTKEVAIRLCEVIIENGKEIDIPASAYYVEEEDAFHVNTDVSEGDDMKEVCEGKDIVYNGETVRVYCIGGWSWIWDEEIVELTTYQKNILYNLSVALNNVGEECEESDFFHNMICELNGFTMSLDELASEIRSKVDGE